MERLKERWKHFHLTEIEEEEVTVNEQNIVHEEKKGEFSLVSKLVADRNVSEEVIRSTMSKVWKTKNPFNVVEIKPNLFIISFENLKDKNRVFNGRPWLFDSFTPLGSETV